MVYLEKNKFFQKLKKVSIAKYTNILIILIILLSSFNNKYWKLKDGVIHWDVVQYYAYLPSAFIYNDIYFKILDEHRTDFTGVFWPIKAPNGNWVNKTSMGMSILYSPFFFMADFSSELLGYKRDGFTLPYAFALAMSSIFYLSLALYFLRKFLEFYFSNWAIAFTIFSIVICTNLLHFTLEEAAMTHVYSFSLISILLYNTIKWYNNPTYLRSILLGFILGLIILIRPTNILIIFFLLLFDIHTVRSLLRRVFYLFNSYKKILAILFTSIIVWIPQFAYWKIVTGNYLFYSYGDEHFFFNNPHIIEGLFGYRGGWLFYTPIMILAIIGIFLLKEEVKKYKLFLITFTILNIYVILSWWCWWYGGGYGNRAFIDSYGVLSIPLASFFSFVISFKKRIIKYFLILIICLFNSLGVFYFLKYHYGSLVFSYMTKEAFWQSFWTLRPKPGFWELLKVPDMEKVKQGKE